MTKKAPLERVNIPYYAILAVESARTVMVARMMRLMNTPPEAQLGWLLAKATRPERAN